MREKWNERRAGAGLARAVVDTFRAASAPIIGLGIVLLLFGWMIPEDFLQVLNFKTVAVQAVIVSLAALGATAVIISGGIDLSPGSTVALSSVILAFLLKGQWPVEFALLACVLAGGLVGILNGTVIVSLRLAPFIVTLGTMGIIRGLAGLIARNVAIQAYVEVQRAAPWLDRLASPRPEPAWLIVAPGVWLVPLLGVLLAFFLCRTAPGRYVFAVGSNETAVRLCGVNISLVKILVYASAGLTAGLAGVMQFARTSVGDPSAASGLELDVIAAVVIGGASLRGGRGSVFGTLLGAFLMALLRNGCNKAGLDIQVQNVIVGVIIIAAAALDQLRHRGAER